MGAQIFGTTADGAVGGGSNTSWAAARALTDGGGTRTDAYGLGGYGSNNAGDDPGDGVKTFVIWRLFLAFDTSVIPDDATISAATLYVKPSSAKYDNGPTNATLCVTSATPANSPPTTADFDQVGSTHLTASGDRPLYSGLTLESYKALPLNSSGLAAISKTATSWFALRTSLDVDNSAPGSGQYVGSYVATADTTGTGSDPYLDVTYYRTVTQGIAVSALATQTATQGLGVAVVGNAYQAAVVASGASSLWPLDETSGSSFADAKSAVAAGSINGSITVNQTGPTSVLTKAFSSGAASGAYLNVGNVYPFTGTSAFTVEAWIKPNTSSVGGRIMAREKTTSSYLGWAFGTTGGKLYAVRYQGTDYRDVTATTTTLASGTWYHVAFTYDGTTMRLYVDGVLESMSYSSLISVTNPSTSDPGASYPLRMFDTSDGTNGRLNAQLSNVAIYPSALSAATLLNHISVAAPSHTATQGLAVKVSAAGVTTTQGLATKVHWPRAAAKSTTLTMGSAGAWDDYLLYLPRVCKNLDGTPYQDSSGRYYVYYTASGNTAGTDRDRVGLARTTDFVTFTKYGTAPVLGWGPSGTYDETGSVWDGTDVAATTVLHDGSQFIMYYEGNSTSNAAGDNIRIGVATSTDGLTWTKDASNPIISFGANGTDAGGDVYTPLVIKDGSTWKMWFGGHSGSHQPSSFGGTYGVMYATATAYNGPFTWHSTSYVFKPTENIGPSQVTKSGGTYTMVFDNYDNLQTIKIATSSDGISWTEQTSVMYVSGAGVWDHGGVYWSDTFTDGGLWRLIYTGHDGAGTPVFGIGSVTAGSRLTTTQGLGVAVGATSATQTTTQGLRVRVLVAAVTTTQGVGVAVYGPTATGYTMRDTTAPFTYSGARTAPFTSVTTAADFDERTTLP